MTTLIDESPRGALTLELRMQGDERLGAASAEAA